MRKLFVWLLLGAAPAGAQTHPLAALMEAARANSPALKQMILDAVPTLKARGGAVVWGQDFLFAVETDQVATVAVDHAGPVAMTRVPDSDVWYRIEKLRVGVTHFFQFYAGGKSMGANFSYDVAGYNPDSYPQAGVPRGTLSEMQNFSSTIYPEMKASYWIYANAGVDPSRPAALMVWQDGETLVGAADLARMRMQIVTDNLVHQKVIPPMVHVLISPGNGKEAQGTRMRSIEYDVVSDRYGRYLLEEILPQVEKSYRLRTDAYSRGIAGVSSGGICALNVAWTFPNQFSRVLSNVGSFTALQWHPEEHLDGGNVFPSKVRREPKRNIRIWMADGSEDNESQAGSWPLQAIQLANSFKLRGYDFHFRFGEGMHSVGQAGLDLPEAFAWLWRGYDQAKTEQTYEMEWAERDQPLYRVKVYNRSAW